MVACASMEDCVFCKIVKGDLPSYKVYEDGEYLSFIDIRPLSPGHILVIPKKHYRFVWDVPDEAFKNYMSVVKKLAQALQNTFGTNMVSSKIVGEEVHHAHVWIFPNPDEATGDKNDFEGNAQKIRSALT